MKMKDGGEEKVGRKDIGRRDAESEGRENGGEKGMKNRRKKMYYQK